MSQITTVYPLSSANGIPIPLDVIEANKLVWLNLNTSPLGAAIDFFSVGGGDIAIFSNLNASANMVVQFGSTPIVLPVAGTSYPNAFLVPSKSSKVVHATDQYFSAICLTGTGRLVVNKITKWDALTLNPFLDQG